MSAVVARRMRRDGADWEWGGAASVMGIGSCGNARLYRPINRAIKMEYPVENGPKIVVRQTPSGSFDCASRDKAARGSAQDDDEKTNKCKDEKQRLRF
jgi:GTP cyclohydrolase III